MTFGPFAIKNHYFCFLVLNTHCELPRRGGEGLKYRNYKTIFRFWPNTPIPILKLHALHKQYTDYSNLASEYEVGSLYKN